MFRLALQFFTEEQRIDCQGNCDFDFIFESSVSFL